jgi:hypothetical protein
LRERYPIKQYQYNVQALALQVIADKLEQGGICLGLTSLSWGLRFSFVFEPVDRDK